MRRFGAGAGNGGLQRAIDDPIDDRWHGQIR
jgi:hypothetical protein